MAVYTLADVSSFVLAPALLVSGYSTIGYVPNEESVRWAISPASGFNYFPEGGGGGGSTRPTSGMLYPRGQG